MTKQNSLVPVSGKWQVPNGTITIDGNTTEIMVVLSFNDKNGQFKISSHITTMQVSRNPDIRQAFLQRKSEMELEAMEYGQYLRDQWRAENRDDNPDQTELPFDEADNDEDKQLSFTAPKKSAKKPAGKKAADVTADDFEDESTLSDGLPM